MENNNNNSDNKHQGIVVVVAMIVAASLLSLGAFATTITPVFADEHDGDDGTEKNIDELIIINKDDKPLSQEGLLQILTEQQPTKPQPTKTVGEGSTVGTDGFSAPSLP